MNPITRLARFLSACPTELRHALTNTLLVAILFPVLTIVSAFGHKSIGAIPLWCIFLTGTLVLLYVLTGVFRYVPLLITVALAAITVSLTGAMDTIAPAYPPIGAGLIELGPLRYIGPLVGILMTVLAVFVLAVSAWTGTFFGLGIFAPVTPELDYPQVQETARSVFEGLCIAAFWLALFSAGVGIGAPHLPYAVTFIILLIAVLLVPGTMATQGRTAFLVMYYVTTAVIVCVVLGAMGYLIHVLLPGLEQPPIVYYASAVALVVLWVIALGIAVKLEQPWISKTATLILLIVPPIIAGVLWYFWHGGMAKTDDWLRIPTGEEIEQARIIYWAFVRAFLLLGVIGVIAALLFMNRKSAGWALLVCAIVIGGGHYIDDLFWAKGKTVKSSVDRVKQIGGFSKTP